MAEPVHRLVQVEQRGLEPFDQRFALRSRAGRRRWCPRCGRRYTGGPRSLVPHQAGVEGQGAGRPVGGGRWRRWRAIPSRSSRRMEIVERRRVGEDVGERRADCPAGRNAEGRAAVRGRRGWPRARRRAGGRGRGRGRAGTLAGGLREHACSCSSRRRAVAAPASRRGVTSRAWTMRPSRPAKEMRLKVSRHSSEPSLAAAESRPRAARDVLRPGGCWRAISQARSLPGRAAGDRRVQAARFRGRRSRGLAAGWGWRSGSGRPPRAACLRWRLRPGSGSAPWIREALLGLARVCARAAGSARMHGTAGAGRSGPRCRPRCGQVPLEAGDLRLHVLRCRCRCR